MAGEPGENLRERLPGVLARGDGHQFRMRMVEQQPDQFLAGITGRADDGDFLCFHLTFLLPQRQRDAEKNFKQKTPPD